jgi:uncharacterized membrane protein
MIKKNWVLILIAVFALAALAVACGGGGSTAPITTVKTDDGKVSFAGTVQPILVDHCKRCHDVGSERSVLMLMTHEGVMKGGKNGAVVVPGDPDASQIIGSVEKKKTPYMPPKVFPALTPDRIASIRAWISEGANNN